MQSLIILSLIFLNFNLEANDKYFAIMGAGAESREQYTTIFDKNFRSAAVYAKSANLKRVDALFNGGHIGTDDLVKNVFPKNSRHFSNQNLKKLIEDYTAKINSGEIKPGDQILLSFDTHSSPRSGGILSHTITTVPDQISDNDKTGYSRFNMDDLIGLMNLARGKNVKLAILDLGCFSGQLMNIEDGHACLISATSKNGIALKNSGSFTQSLFKSMKPGISLEEAFLRARLASSGERSLPLISTPEGLSVYFEMVRQIEAFVLAGGDGKASYNNLDAHIKGLESEILMCEQEKYYREALSAIDKVEKLGKLGVTIAGIQIGFNPYSFKKLRRSLGEYKKIQDQLLGKYKKMREKLLVPYEIKYKDENGLEKVANVSISDLIMAEYESMLARELSYKEKNEYRINLIKECIKKRDELLKSNSITPSDLKFLENVTADLSNTLELAQKIASEERKIYDSLYADAKKNNDNKTNPCSDFIL